MGAYSLADILQIATWQKYILLCIVLSFVSIFLPGEETTVTVTVAVVSLLVALFIVAVWVASIISAYKLVCALKMGKRVLWVIGMFVPILSTILLVLNHFATKAIRSGGFRVGLMGATTKEIEAKIAETNAATPSVAEETPA